MTTAPLSSAPVPSMRWLRSPWIAALGVFGVGALLTLAAAAWQARANVDSASRRFDALAARAAEQVIARLQTYEHGVRGARGAVIAAGTEQIDRQRFRAYGESREVAREFPGARGFGIIRRVPAATEAAFIEAARRDGQADFRIRQPEPHAGDRYVIQYIEPVESERASIGLDVASEANSREAAERSMRSGEATLTGPITPVPADGKPLRSFLLMLPIYERARVLDSPAQRELATFGWVYASLVIDEVLADFDFRGGEFTLTLRDVSGPDARTFFVSPGGEAPATAGLERRVTLALFGRAWEVEVRARPPFLAALNPLPPAAVATVGVAVAALLAIAMFLYARGFERAAQVQIERTRRAAIADDIAAAQQVERRLRSSEAFLDRTGRIAGVGGWAYDMQSRQVTWTAQTFRTHEVDIDYEPRLESQREFYPPEAWSQLYRESSAAMVSGGDWDIELPFITAKGRRRWVRIVGTAEIEGGKPARLLGTLQDITDRKEAEAEALRNLQLLRGAIDTIDEAFVLFDPHDRLLLINDKCRELLGNSADLIQIGRSFEEMLRAGAQRGHYPEALGRVEAWVAERMAARRDNGPALVMRLESGRVLRVIDRRMPDGHTVGFRVDITELMRATEAAQAASDAKSQFLANMSHEIRSPMNAVIGLAHLLRQTELNPTQAGFLDKMTIASKSLLSVINDVLDLSKIEAGELLIEQAPFSPRRVVEEQAEVIGVSARAKGIAFEIDIAADLPEAVSGDAKYVGQIVSNLMSNAVKFTDHGTVGVHMQVLRETPAEVTLSFVVRDTGVGVAPELQARLFAPFAQADASITRRFGGTGLGLSIVKRLVDLMGGTIGLSSVPGAGSEFRVELPFARAAAHDAVREQAVRSQPSHRALRGLRLLVVDDNLINLEVAQPTLELEGAHVTTASGGQQAIDLLSAQPDAFDLVLMDVQMPVLDGLEATRRIRAELGLTRLPIVALTAGALSSERQRVADAGMNDFILKPFDAGTLTRCILRQIRTGAQHAPILPEPLARAVKPLLPPGWPSIRGIDLAAVQERFGDDVALFGSMLQRLLDEFADVSIRPLADAGDALGAHAQAMHQLRGIAGMLGAGAVHRLAGEIEAACLAHDADRVEALGLQLTRELRELRAAAA